MATLAGQDLDYVLIDGIGDDEAWDGIDLTGKVAVCARGDISFADKAQYAADAGAAAILIYNNEAGSINMDLLTTPAPPLRVHHPGRRRLDEGASGSCEGRSRGRPGITPEL